jgi:hypothetical protein
MGRKILFVTTDQQRYDSLGCTGGTVARTPVADRLAATGVNYRRAMNQNAAYDAPFPDDSHKAGARVFPTLVPTRPGGPFLQEDRGPELAGVIVDLVRTTSVG